MKTIENEPEHDKPNRLHEIDWLRVTGVLAVFLFHCSHYFDFEDWHVKNPTSNIFVAAVAALLITWALPLIFVVSGISARISLSYQKPAQFARSKVSRLLVPLVFGIFFLTPHQVYIERLTHGEFTGSFFAFLPRYFDGLYGINGNFGWMGLHLWYLEMLFVYSLVLLPLFLLLRKETILERVSRFFSRPGMIYLLLIPLVLLEVFPDPEGLGMRVFAGWGVLTYLVIFICGYAVFSSAEVRRAAERIRLPVLALALASFSTMAYMERTGLITPHGTARYAVFIVVRTLCMFSFVVALVGFAARSLKIESRFLSYANEAVLPFYILHQPVIVAVGFFIMSWDIHPIPKWLFLIVSSFVLIMAVYNFVVKLSNPLRFLFGMKLQREIK